MRACVQQDTCVCVRGWGSVFLAGRLLWFPVHPCDPLRGARVKPAGLPSSHHPNCYQPNPRNAPGSSCRQLQWGRGWVLVTPNLWAHNTHQPRGRDAGHLPSTEQPVLVPPALLGCVPGPSVRNLLPLPSGHPHDHIQGPLGSQASRSFRITWKLS